MFYLLPELARDRFVETEAPGKPGHQAFERKPLERFFEFLPADRRKPDRDLIDAQDPVRVIQSVRQH